MALSANSVVEVRAAGNDTNGGGFVTGAAGTDYSQQAAANSGGNDSSTTDAVAIGTTTITSATASFQTTIVGNIIYLAGGTGSLAAGWYQVTARASTTSITVDRNVATGTGITMNIGGALLTPGMVGGYGLVSGAVVHQAAGTYSVTSATPNISGGCFSTTLTVFSWQGYQTTRGDLGTPPLIQASGISTFTLFSSTGADVSVANIRCDGASLTSSRGIVCRGVGYKLTAENCTNSGLARSNFTAWIRCLVTGCSTQPAVLGGGLVASVVHTNTVTAFSIDTPGYATLSLFYGNTGASSDAIELSGASGSTVQNCTIYASGRDGIRFSDDGCAALGNIVEGCAGIGINANNNDGIIIVNNATYNNGTGINVGTGKGVISVGNVAGSGSFFTDAAAGDFSLNNASGAGAAARAAGYPGVFPGGLTTGYLDIGAAQHADPAATPVGRSLIATRASTY